MFNTFEILIIQKRAILSLGRRHPDLSLAPTHNLHT